MASTEGESAVHTNRLSRESSPYLLQHQHNPVDWYAWGEEAFDAAREQDRPIFLSVGYSTCYWCHVMERQSFENDAIAKEMNDRFICIKVDREERPDVDQLYMAAVQVMTRQGGWPMSVFLTPDLRPFYGGTYFPPTDMQGRPGFVSVLRGLDDAYHNRRADVDQTANQLAHVLRQISEPEAPAGAITIDENYIDNLIARSTSDYEPQYGGFGNAPKFPRQTLLELLLVHQRNHPDSNRMRMIRHALDAMMRGGIRDHLGGGFHRYSTDSQWLVPHFEIMLYDNAMLGWCYVEAFAQTKDERYANVARGIFDFILNEMTSPEGAFFTAMDAEVDAREGLSYLWTKQEIEQILDPEDAELFNRVYGVDRGPNFADPHHGNGTPDRNILFLADPDLYQQERSRLEPMRRKLKAARDERKQPLLDTKILTSWNALMIRALAFGGRVLKEQRYADAAERAANFLLNHHRTADGGLFRTSRDGAAKHAGFLDDYAFLIQALIECRDLEGPDDWDKPALALAAMMRDRFEDPERGGFYFTESGAKDLIIRQKTASDSPLPSGNSVAAMVMLTLDEPESAKRVLETFAGQLDRGAEGMSSMVQAAGQYVREKGALEIAAGAAASASGAPGGANVGQRPPSLEEVAGRVVTISAEWKTDTQLDVYLRIDPEFHINAHEASLGLIATELAVAGDGQGLVAGVDYPPGEMRKMTFADEPIRIYDGTVPLSIRFKSAPPGDKLTLLITYQACNEIACLQPVMKQFEIVTRIT